MTSQCAYTPDTRVRTLSQASMMSCMEMSFSSHSLISSSKGLMKGEPRIVCALMMWSSRSTWMSSIDDRMCTPCKHTTHMQRHKHNVTNTTSQTQRRKHVARHMNVTKQATLDYYRVLATHLFIAELIH